MHFIEGVKLVVMLKDKIEEAKKQINLLFQNFKNCLKNF
ncbi:hypothetical protein Sdiek1_2267 [Sulfurospirillum diekertiae]|uniref:Uncharacterized protein n=1 Tax=Sulfurospirillum diekertiae TaxID=1854492 RepID=A0A1Y0HMU2_9BACT|nr:hypothetical protein Sdiek1_2267 [Sulfurospirillum diekertiae]ASC94225.1 hypothetical protein Sdiek2_2218 [Sulfurospirillum diekertiae]